MAKTRLSEEQQPLYVRWIPDTCPYALEMRFDLIARIKNELALAESANMEIGGVFFGVPPTQSAPTLRLDDLIIVPGGPAVRRGNQPLEYTLDAGQLRHLAEMSAESYAAGRPFVGFLRSHMRATPMAPTAVDVAMLAPQFPDGLFAFLLIAPRPGRVREAAFFLAMGGQLETVPSTEPFAFDESTFKSLREVPAEATEDVRNFNFTRTKRPMPWAAVLSFGLVVCLIGTWTLGSRIAAFFRPPSNQVDLSVIKEGSNLKITWDHSAPVLGSAQGATLVIMDGTNHRELKLDSDDLKRGQVSYERLTKRVYVVMSLDAPGSKLPAQTFDWTSD